METRPGIGKGMAVTVAVAKTAKTAETRKGAITMGGTIKGKGIGKGGQFGFGFRVAVVALMALAVFSPLGALRAEAATPPAKPAFCNGHDANAKKLTFRWVALFVDANKPNYDHVYGNRYQGYAGHRPTLRPGDSFYIIAHVTDCNEGANENNNSHARFEYRGPNNQRHDGPSPSFTRVAGNQYDGLYVAKVTLFGHNPCQCDRIALKQLYMGDRTGGHTFTVAQYGWMNDAWGNYRRP